MQLRRLREVAAVEGLLTRPLKSFGAMFERPRIASSAPARRAGRIWSSNPTNTVGFGLDPLVSRSTFTVNVLLDHKFSTLLQLMPGSASARPWKQRVHRVYEV